MANQTWYVVDETKLDNLSAQNDESRSFFSAAAGFASLAIGLFSQQAFVDKLSDRGWIVVWVASPVCVVISLIALCLGARRYWNGKSILRAIKANKTTTSVKLRLDAE
jgi:hypothetical protein